MRRIEEWYDTLVQLTEDTEYGVLLKTKISSPLVAIVPKNFDTPQRIAIYPKKIKNAGLVIEKDVFSISKIQNILGEGREHGNRPHYNNVPDDVILAVCKAFLFKV